MGYWIVQIFKYADPEKFTTESFRRAAKVIDSSRVNRQPWVHAPKGIAQKLMLDGKKVISFI